VENLFPARTPAGPTSAAAYDAKLHGPATVTEQASDALAVQEIGDPAALDDLIGLLAGDWQVQLSGHPDGRGIRVGWLTRRPISDPAEILEIPAPLPPVQVDDSASTLGQMGRGALAVTVPSDAGIPVRLITTHLKSKLLTFPGGRFIPQDEDERARYAGYALTRRAAEATTVRVAVTEALGGHGEQRPVVLTGTSTTPPRRPPPS
jgi:hypothetical protein